MRDNFRFGLHAERVIFGVKYHIIKINVICFVGAFNVTTREFAYELAVHSAGWPWSRQRTIWGINPDTLMYLLIKGFKGRKQRGLAEVLWSCLETRMVPVH